MMFVKKFGVFILVCLLVTVIFSGCVQVTTPIAPEIDPDFVIGEISTVNPEENPNGDVDVLPPSSEVWVPDIIDKDTDKSLEDSSFDDSVKYVYSDPVFTAKQGNFLSSDGIFTTTVAHTLATTNQTPFPYGTISCTVTSSNTCDTGIVFGLTDSNAMSYWENGVSYYFYFVGQGGNAYLGKVNNGTWSALSVVSIGGTVQQGKEYDLKVVVKSNVMICYMDGELMFSYRDNAFLKGTGYGIRSGMSGATFKNFNVTSEYVY